jgi:hypothetical protein
MVLTVVGHLRRHVVGYVALFFALGGTAFAAAPYVVGNGTAVAGALDLPATANPSGDPNQLPWSTLVSLPGVADLQMACDQNEMAYVRLVNRSNRVLLVDSAGPLLPGTKEIIDQGNSLPAHTTGRFLVHEDGGNDVATINFGGTNDLTHSGGYPTEPPGCHGFAQAIVQSVGG